jgi:restriction system protein
MVKAGLVGVMAFGLLALSAISALRSLKTRGILDAQNGIETLREMRWKSFEDILAEVYRRQGYKVEEMLGGGADGGVDLILRKNGSATVVQCKRWKGRRVPVQVVRELYGVMVDRGAWAAKVVATTTFTPDAVTFANGKPIELVDSAGLIRLVRGVQKSPRIPVLPAGPDHLTPDCPSCSATMVLRTARRGRNAGEKFWGCPTYPHCRGTRPL